MTMAPLSPKHLVFVAVILCLLPVASCFTNPRVITSYQSKTSALSAHESRRNFIQTLFTSVGVSAIVHSILPSIANADASSANIKMPNYIEYLIEKNKVIDPNDMLYKGPDVETQLRRIGEASNRLPEIATLAEEKKWSQVQGIITGPLGTLLQTINSVASISGTKEAKDLAKLVKADLFEIGVAAGKKQSELCIKAADKTTKDLSKFVMVAFETK